MRVVAFSILLLSLTTAGVGGLPAGFTRARDLYFRGSTGDKQAYDQADQLFTELYKRDADEPRIAVYYGSLRLLEASHSWALWKKNSLSKEGIRLMDKAVGRAPGDLEVRFVRAATTYDLPGFFHRREQSAQDFKLLAEHAEEAAKTGALEPRLAAASLYYRGRFLKDARQEQAAMSVWKTAIAIAPDSRAARESREELNKAERQGEIR